MAEKSPIPLDRLRMPLKLVEIITETRDGEPVVVLLEVDDKGKLSVRAETPREP